MLLVLMFHQIVSPNSRIQLDAFINFLQDLQRNFSFSVPGKKLASGLNICLTFDDAYFDFYHYIYPLLKEYKIPSVLAIPVSLIKETTKIPYQKRLSVNYPNGMDANIQENFCSLCTWEEIYEMVKSGYVMPASHSLTHPNLTEITHSQIIQEIDESKQILESKVDSKVDTFIYPYGKTNKQVHQEVCRYYQYAMRIGSALNMISGWDKKNLIYRIDADLWWKQGNVIRIRKLLHEYCKYYLNIWRGK